MKQIAEEIIRIRSKKWLSNYLGISRPTLDTRLKKGNWKKLEILALNKLKGSIFLSKNLNKMLNNFHDV